jgi:Ca2+-binding RTX toxin-like protein
MTRQVRVQKGRFPMAIQIQPSDTTSTVTVPENTTFLLREGVLIAPTTGNGINLTAGSRASVLFLDGTVLAGGFDVALEVQSGAFSTVTVGATGSLYAKFTAIEAFDFLELNNHGTISGSGTVLKLGGGGSGSRVVNTGLITGQTGIELIASDFSLTNSGLLTAEDFDVIRASGVQDTSGVELNNSGVMRAGQHILDNTHGDNSLVNTGEMFGGTGIVEIDQGGNSIVNGGTMTAHTGVAIFIDDAANAGGNTVTNTGTITSAGKAIDIDGANSVGTNGGTITSGGLGIHLSVADNSSITNSGHMTTGGDAMAIFGEDARYTNTGVIDSGGSSIFSFSATRAQVLNTGTMTSRGQGAGLSGDDISIENSGSISAQSTGLSVLGSRTVVSNTGSITATDTLNAGVASAGDGVHVDGSNTRVVNDGTITAENDGVDLDNADAARVLNTGIINAGANGVILAGADNGVVINRGEISAGDGLNAGGIEIEGDGARIVNTGLISGDTYAVAMFTNDNLAAATLKNSGVIEIDLSQGSVAVHGDVDHIDIIRNTGIIKGGTFQQGGNDLMVNAGQIFGDAVLGTGNDKYVGRGGEVTGNVSGGDGDDTLVGGDEDDRLLGDAGKDKLLGRGGDDVLTGGSSHDDLRGNSGDDTLNGSAGKDRLDGGRGSDVLIGGGGADTFVYGLQGGIDRITDYTDGTDKIDLSAYGLTNLADLVASHTVKDTASGVRIGFSDGNALVVAGITVSDLDNGDFIF